MKERIKEKELEDEFFDGIVTNIKTFDRALTEEEIEIEWNKFRLNNRMKEKISPEELLDELCDFIKHNWNASLGYDEDEKVVRENIEEFDWLLRFLEISDDEFVEYFLNY